MKTEHTANTVPNIGESKAFQQAYAVVSKAAEAWTASERTDPELYSLQEAAYGAAYDTLIASINTYCLGLLREQHSAPRSAALAIQQFKEYSIGNNDMISDALDDYTNTISQFNATESGQHGVNYYLAAEAAYKAAQDALFALMDAHLYNVLCRFIAEQEHKKETKNPA